jgi:hypothetical protein
MANSISLNFEEWIHLLLAHDSVDVYGRVDSPGLPMTIKIHRQRCTESIKQHCWIPDDAHSPDDTQALAAPILPRSREPSVPSPRTPVVLRLEMHPNGSESRLAGLPQAAHLWPPSPDQPTRPRPSTARSGTVGGRAMVTVLVVAAARAAPAGRLIKDPVHHDDDWGVP